jgi:hypothetical protein
VPFKYTLYIRQLRAPVHVLIEQSEAFLKAFPAEVVREGVVLDKLKKISERMGLETVISRFYAGFSVRQAGAFGRECEDLREIIAWELKKSRVEGRGASLEGEDDDNEELPELAKETRSFRSRYKNYVATTGTSEDFELFTFDFVGGPEWQVERIIDTRSDLDIVDAEETLIDVSGDLRLNSAVGGFYPRRLFPSSFSSLTPHFLTKFFTTNPFTKKELDSYNPPPPLVRSDSAPDPVREEALTVPSLHKVPGVSSWLWRIGVCLDRPHEPPGTP